MLTFLLRLIIGKRDWVLIDKEIVLSMTAQLINERKVVKMKFHPDDLYKLIILTFKCQITGKVKTKVIRA